MRAIALTYVLFATNAYATPADDAAVLNAVARKLCIDVEKYAILSSVAVTTLGLFDPRDEPQTPHAVELAALAVRNPKGSVLPNEVDYACLHLTDAKDLHVVFSAEKHNGWDLFRKSTPLP